MWPTGHDEGYAHATTSFTSTEYSNTFRGVCNAMKGDFMQRLLHLNFKQVVGISMVFALSAMSAVIILGYLFVPAPKDGSGISGDMSGTSAGNSQLSTTRTPSGGNNSNGNQTSPTPAPSGSAGSSSGAGSSSVPGSSVAPTLRPTPAPGMSTAPTTSPGSTPTSTPQPTPTPSPTPTPTASYCSGRTPCYGPNILATHTSTSAGVSNGCWGYNIDQVFNLTGFAPVHPNGAGNILTSTVCGNNIASILGGTASSGGGAHNHFAATKSNSASSLLHSYFVGYYDPAMP